MSQSELINVGWIAVCTAMVFMMQAGFCCLESGLVRSKNSINVAIKNLVDFAVAGALFWMFGNAIIFGDSFAGLLGVTGFFYNGSVDPTDDIVFVFGWL